MALLILLACHGLTTGSALADQTPAEHASEEAAGEQHEGETPNLLKPEPGLLIWTLITFGILIVVLSRTAWGPLMRGLEAREQRIRKTIEDADVAKREAEDVLSRYQKMLDSAKAEAQEIIEEGKSDAVRLKHSITQEAREEAEQFKSRARREVELATDQAKKELWDESSRLATMLAEKILKRNLDSEDHRRLVDSMLADYQSQQTTSG